MTSPLPDRVAREIRAELARQEMTQAALAAKIGKTEFYVSRRLGAGDARKTPIDMADLELIAEALGVPVSRFVSPRRKAGTDSASAA